MNMSLDWYDSCGEGRMPEISVIMPVYNGEKYILRSIMSILCQSYKDFELIVIDDGSHDRTGALISQIKDDRLRFFSQENLGLTKSLNRALAMAKGRWIARHDADDFSMVSRFREQVEVLKKNPDIGLLGSNCFIQPERLGVINEIYKYPEDHVEIINAYTEYNPFVHGSVIIKRDLLEQDGGYNENYRYVQDYELWSRLLLKTRVRNLSLPLYARTVHSQSSQLVVDKGVTFREIRDKYLNSNSRSRAGVPVRPIDTVSLYPWASGICGWNRLISRTFYQMGLVAKQMGLPWRKLILQSLIYSPLIK